MFDLKITTRPEGKRSADLQNTSARHCLTTPLLHELHQLPVSQPILLLCFKVITKKHLLSIMPPSHCNLNHNENCVILSYSKNSVAEWVGDLWASFKSNLETLLCFFSCSSVVLLMMDFTSIKSVNLLSIILQFIEGVNSCNVWFVRGAFVYFIENGAYELFMFYNLHRTFVGLLHRVN